MIYTRLSQWISIKLKQKKQNANSNEVDWSSENKRNTINEESATKAPKHKSVNNNTQ